MDEDEGDEDGSLALIFPRTMRKTGPSKMVGNDDENDGHTNHVIPYDDDGSKDLDRRDDEKDNEGSRIYDKFPQVLRNLSRCPELDIRDLTIHELSLAGKPSWVLRRSALLGNKKKPSANKTIATPVDWADVQLSVDDITASQWFDTAKSNPPLVAYIMDKINDRVVNKAVNV